MRDTKCPNCGVEGIAKKVFSDRPARYWCSNTLCLVSDYFVTYKKAGEEKDKDTSSEYSSDDVAMVKLIELVDRLNQRTLRMQEQIDVDRPGDRQMLYKQVADSLAALIKHYERKG